MVRHVRSTTIIPAARLLTLDYSYIGISLIQIRQTNISTNRVPTVAIQLLLLQTSFDRPLVFVLSRWHCVLDTLNDKYVCKYKLWIFSPNFHE